MVFMRCNRCFRFVNVKFKLMARKIYYGKIVPEHFAAYISTRFLIHTTIFLEKTSPPLPAGVRIDLTVVTQSSYFHMYSEVQKNLFDVFPMQSHGGQFPIMPQVPNVEDCL